MTNLVTKGDYTLAMAIERAVNPAPYTLHPTPCTLHPTYTLHPKPYTLYPEP